MISKIIEQYSVSSPPTPPFWSGRKCTAVTPALKLLYHLCHTKNFINFMAARRNEKKMGEVGEWSGGAKGGGEGGGGGERV